MRTAASWLWAAALGAAVLAAPVLAVEGAREEGLTREAEARLDALRERVARVMAEEAVPGAAFALLPPRGAAARRFLGRARDDGTPVGPGTVFRLGSISKTALALAVLELAREGRLDLDAPVAPRLPGLGLENPWEARHPITPRMLLEHSAGLDDFGLREVFEPGGREDVPLREVLCASFAPRRVRWPPGSRHAYSNPGYLVLGRLLEALDGVPYEAAVARRVFAPLGMTGAALSRAGVPGGALADGHAGPFARPVPYRPIYFRPAANGLGRLEDLEALAGAVRAGLAGARGRLVAEALRAPRTTAAAGLGLGLGYAAGVEVRLAKGERLWGHRGGGYSFAAGFGILPRTGWGYALALNASAERALPRLEGLLVEALRSGEAPAGAGAGAGGGSGGADGAEGTDPGEGDWAGRYVKGNPRHRSFQLFERLFSHRTVERRADGTWIRRRDGKARRLEPAGPGLWRLAGDREPSLATFRDPGGRRVLVDGSEYFEEAGGLEAVGSFLVGLALLVALGAPLGFMGLDLVRGLAGRVAGRVEPARIGPAPRSRVHLVPCVGSLLLLGFGLSAWTLPVHELGRLTSATGFAFGLGLAHGAIGPAGAWHALACFEAGEGRVRCALAGLAAVAHLAVSLLLTASGIVGAPLW